MIVINCFSEILVVKGGVFVNHFFHLKYDINNHMCVLCKCLLLQRLTDLISCELDDHDILLPTSSTSVAEAKHLQYNLTVLELLAEMCGQLSVSCFTSPKYIIKFVKVIMQ